MSFYLLKSTYRREEVGDVLINLDEIESLAAVKKKFKDTENEIFMLLVTMKSSDTWQASFLKEEELKKVIAEILGGSVSESAVKELIPQDRPFN